MWPKAPWNELQRSTTVIIEHQKETSPHQQLGRKWRPAAAKTFTLWTVASFLLCSLMIQMVYFLCSPHLRSSSQNMLRPWRDMHGSLLILTAKVKRTHLFPTTVFHHPNGGLNTIFVFCFCFISDLSAGECLPAPAISSGEFCHAHTCALHRISWSILLRKGKMVIVTFML